jgi:hypothetical protein
MNPAVRRMLFRVKQGVFDIALVPNAGNAKRHDDAQSTGYLARLWLGLKVTPEMMWRRQTNALTNINLSTMDSRQWPLRRSEPAEGASKSYVTDIMVTAVISNRLA